MRGWVLLGAALVLGGPAAQAQMDSREAIQLQNQILGMRRDIQALQQGQGSAPARAPRYAGGDADPGTANGLTAQLLDRVSTLEDQVRELRGQLDRVANQQQRQGEDLGKQIADMNFALQQGQGGAPPPRPQGPPPSALGGSGLGSPGLGSPGLGSPGLAAGPPPGAATPPRTPELAMQEGNAALARRDYAAAIAAAKEVIAKKGPRQADAQFLLAQAESGQRNYQQAAPDFYDAYNRARTGPHAADSLLGLANALLMVGEKTSACEALAKMRTEFPQPRPDQRETELATRQRASCR